MIANIFGEGVSYIILIGLAFLWIYYLIQSSEAEKRLKERQHLEARADAAKEAADIVEELDLVKSARDLLPDLKAALNIVMHRFTWTDLRGAIRVDKLQMKLLSEISIQGSRGIELPNLKSSRFGRLEQDCVREIQSKVFHLQTGDTETDNESRLALRDEMDVYGLESVAQSPTVGTLQSLVMMGFVSVEGEITSECREYDCEATSRGLRLLELHLAYSGGPKKFEIAQRLDKSVTVSLQGFMAKALETPSSLNI